MVGLEMQCGPKCRSRQHTSQLINAVARGNLRQIQLFLTQCFNAATNTDARGRTVLQIAASCGKWQVVAWLLNDCGANLNTKDTESGWTALHRAIFYGQLTSARLLISYGANVQSRDKEGLTALDIAMKDRLPHVEFVLTGLNEAFTWGDNANFTLGHDNEQRRKHPEPVEVFRKQGISIKQVVMCKYHTVFLSTSGQVYTCGHGRGGRLGHGTEQTCLEPKLLMLKDEVCTQVSASRDHTVLLMESGAIYTCGYNEYFQFPTGHAKSAAGSLAPKLLTNKGLKTNKFSGVLVLRYHMVLFNEKVIFTFGLNAGQLGHQKNPSECSVTQPRQVSALNHKDLHLKIVAASDAATVVVTQKGDVYALHEYQCRRIISKRLDIEQVCVDGGNLDPHTALDTLKEHGGTDLTVAIRTSLGKIYVWRANVPVLKRCAWVLRRSLYITDMALNQSSLAFITKEGEAFVATLPKKKTKERTVSHSTPREILSTSLSDNFSISVTELVERDEAEDVSVERVPLVHRAIGITTDHKGRNMAVLQAQPNANLTEIPGVLRSDMTSHFGQLLREADNMDTIHDTVLQVGHTEIPSHRYILAFRSEYFKNVFVEDPDQQVNSALEKPVVNLGDVNIEIFQQLLQFIYTDTCDLLTVGKAFTLREACTTEETAPHKHRETCFQEDVEPINGHKMSAFAVHQAKNTKKKGLKKGKVEEKESSNSKHKTYQRNPITMLQNMAKKFGVKDLARRLESVQCVNGTVVKVPGKKIQQPNLKFQKHKLSMMYDVCIAAEDGKLIKCHKCILVARLEYFKSMLASGWVETSDTKALSLPVPGDILKMVILHLYVDDCPMLRDCQDVEFLCNVLVMADQLLIERLKQQCEVLIAGLITLRNVCELLEFSSMYNASQLKVTCQQYVTINITALLETKSLDVLSDDVMEELSQYYKDTIPGMDRRRLTPYDGWPDMAHLERLEAQYGDSALEGTPGVVTPSREDHVTRKNRGKKKRSRTKSSGEDTTDKTGEDSPRSEGQGRGNRQISVGSDTSFTVELDNIDEAFDEEPVEKRDKDNPWTTIKVRVPKSLPKSCNLSGDIPTQLNGGIGAGNHVVPSDIAERGSVSEVMTVSQGSDRIISPPTSPGSEMSKSPLGLRSIMAEQEAAAGTRQKLSSTGGGSKKAGRLSHKDWKKLTDPDHQEVTAKVKVAGSQASPDQGGPIIVKSSGEGAKPKTWSSSANAWGAVSSVVSSFKDLMLTEETGKTIGDYPRSQTTLPSTANSISPQNKTISWGIQKSNPRKAKPTTPVSPKPPSEPSSPSSPSTAENPWQKKVTASAPAPKQSLSFTDIMMDEIQQKKTLDRASKKPLSLIQMEEQAIFELLQHYKAEETLDECITVERVHTTLATPMWAATQRTREA